MTSEHAEGFQQSSEMFVTTNKTESILDQVNAFIQDGKVKVNQEQYTSIDLDGGQQMDDPEIIAGKRVNTMNNFEDNNGWNSMYLDSTLPKSVEELNAHHEPHAYGSEIGNMMQDLLGSPKVPATDGIELHESPFIAPVLPDAMQTGNYNNRMTTSAMDFITNTPFLRAQNNSSLSIRKRHPSNHSSPLTSPAITPSTSSKVIKQSPLISAINNSSNSSRRSFNDQKRGNNRPSSVNVPHQELWEDLLFKLPESTIEPTTTSASTSASTSATTQLANVNTHDSGNTFDNANYFDSTNDLNDHSTTASVAVPMMKHENFRYEEYVSTKNNAQNYDNEQTKKEKPKEEKMTKITFMSESPNSQPKKPQKLKHISSRKFSQTQLDSMVKEIQLPSRNVSTSTLSSQQIVSPIITPETSKATEDEMDYLKRSYHKVAEQERRNRMKIAINELKALLPEEMRASGSSLSKANTVERACQYIRQLQAERENK